MVRTGREGLCGGCRPLVRAEVASRTERVKDALVFIRCARDPNTALPLCDEAIEHARHLVSFEKRGLSHIRPVPSSLLAMLEAKREELAAEIRAAHAPRSAQGPAPETSPDAETPPAADSEGNAWWAWKDEEAGEAPAGARPTRERLHCLVLLDPGGIRATLENISLGGLFLSTPRMRPLGSRVRVILNTPQGPLQAEGVVRWTRPEVTSGPTGMGVEFTHSSPELAAYLASRFPGLRSEGAT
ncbi:MAG: PilZ domain-containing protein [Thermodesulfobacteriota bacterium]